MQALVKGTAKRRGDSASFPSCLLTLQGELVWVVPGSLSPGTCGIYTEIKGLVWEWEDEPHTPRSWPSLAANSWRLLWCSDSLCLHCAHLDIRTRPHRDKTQQIGTLINAQPRQAVPNWLQAGQHGPAQLSWAILHGREM